MFWRRKTLKWELLFHSFSVIWRPSPLTDRKANNLILFRLEMIYNTYFYSKGKTLGCLRPWKGESLPTSFSPLTFLPFDLLLAISSRFKEITKKEKRITEEKRLQEAKGRGQGRVPSAALCSFLPFCSSLTKLILFTFFFFVLSSGRKMLAMPK